MPKFIVQMQVPERILLDVEVPVEAANEKEARELACSMYFSGEIDRRMFVECDRTTGNMDIVEVRPARE